MRDEHKDSAADAGEQLPLLDAPAAPNASRKSARRRRRPVVETTTTQSGVPEPGPLGFFVIFLWLLSNEKKDPLDWPGVAFTLEEAARHHAMIFDE